MSCPFCRDLLSGATANDGGSLLCLRCGLLHYCVDGPVKSAVGPASCPRCVAARRMPSAPTGASMVSSGGAQLPTYCPFCAGPIESDPSGNGYRCFACGPWHMCSNGPLRAAAAMCAYCSARSTRSSRHALPHPQPLFGVALDKTPRQLAPSAPAYATHAPACPTCQRPF